MGMLSCLVYRRDEKTDLLVLADDALQPLLSSPLCTRFRYFRIFNILKFNIDNNIARSFQGHST